MAKPGAKYSTLTADLLSGLTAAIPSIPDALASGVLAGVSPVYGLYGLMVGTPVAALFTGSAFMSVVTTSAMCIAVGEALAGYQGEAQIQATVTLALIIGIVQLAAGLLRLGFLVRFVSNAVMTGFLSGIALLIVLSQIGDLTGYRSEYSNKVVQVVDTLLHVRQIEMSTTLVGVTAMALIVLLGRTRLRNFAMLLALIGAALLVPIFNLEGVVLVGETSDIPRGLPLPSLPIPLLDWELIVSGIAVAIIGLIQGAGISGSYPNPDGKYPDVSRDFSGQGLANLAVSLFRGLPVGGSLSSTALVVSTGAKSRLANIFTGLFAILAVLLLGPQIEKLPMAALAAMLVVAGVQSFNRERIRTVWETSLFSRLVMASTFVATLIFPIQVAVFLGVLISILVYVFRSAERMRVTEILPLGDGRYEQRLAPAELPGDRVTVLMPEGSLFFAGAADLEEELPAVENTRRPVVVLRLRGRQEIGSTFIRVLDRYAQALKANGGKLVLAGVSEPVYRQLERTGVLVELGEENVYRETRILGESALHAYQDAQTWLSGEEATRNPGLHQPSPSEP